jgi:hypothetical protein
MLRVAVRIVIAVLIGSAVAVAMVMAYAADLLDRQSAAVPTGVRNGTTSGSAESLQRIHFLDRAT